MTIPKNVKEIMQKLIDNNYEVRIIGGAIRDYFLGLEPHDWDLFTNATGDQILALFPYGKILGGDERQEKILTVIVNDIEVSQYRANGDRTKTGRSLNEHLATCDFTVNAIAMDINGKIYDPYNGSLDIYQRVLRFVGNGKDRIKECPNRIMRYMRFLPAFPNSTEINIILENINLLDTLHPNIIREEFLKIIKHPQGIENLWEDDIIYKIIPELKQCMNKEGGDHHGEPVDKHMKLSFERACEITDNIILRLGIFLHDIGKGYTQTFDEDGKQVHFYQHEKVGAKLAESIMKRLKFSKDDIRYVTTLIASHMYSYKDKPSRKSYIKFFNKLESAGISITDYTMMLYCDNQGNVAKLRIAFGDFINNNWLHNEYYKLKYSEVPFNIKDLKISGKDLIKLGMKPSPMMGQILKTLFDEIMEAKLKNFKPDLIIRAKEIIKLSGTIISPIKSDKEEELDELYMAIDEGIIDDKILND